MTYTLLSVSSVTYAMKGKSILNNMGRYAEIERQDRNTRTGCGYMLRIKDDPALITGVLEKHGIKVTDKRTVERRK